MFCHPQSCITAWIVFKINNCSLNLYNFLIYSTKSDDTSDSKIKVLKYMHQWFLCSIKTCLYIPLTVSRIRDYLDKGGGDVFDLNESYFQTVLYIPSTTEIILPFRENTRTLSYVHIKERKWSQMPCWWFIVWESSVCSFLSFNLSSVLKRWTLHTHNHWRYE